MEFTEWTSYTCYGSSVYEEKFSTLDCRQSSIISSLEYTNYYNYQCGLGGNCDYITLYTFNHCDGQYFQEDDGEDEPIGNYTRIMEIVGENIYYGDEEHYTSTCAKGYSKIIYKLTTAIPTEPTDTTIMEST